MSGELDEKGLLPCPFCGGAAKYHHRDDGTGWSNTDWVCCQNEDCGCQTCLHETADLAITAWNRRVYLSASPSPSEMEVVANLRSDAAQLLRMSKATAFGEDLSVRVAKPDLLIANMVAAADTVEALSAQVLRLTEENKALRFAHKSMADFVGPRIPEGQNVEQAESFLAWIGMIVRLEDRGDKAIASTEAAEARIKALEEALREIRELNTIGADENGHRWSHSDLIDQVIIPLLAAPALSTKTEGGQ